MRVRSASTDVRRPLARFAAWAARPHRLYAASLCRIGFGSIAFAFMLVLLPERAALFSAGGIESAADYERWVAPGWGETLFTRFVPAGLDDGLYAACMAIVVLYIAGFATRIVSVLFCAVVWSVTHRCPQLFDAGYRVVDLMSIYLAFADQSAHLSVDAALRRRFARTYEPSFTTAVFHNAAMLTCVAQLCVIYLFAAFAKVQGEPWRDGTPLYYATAGVQWNTSAISSAIVNSPLLVAAGGYATMLFQGAFPWLLASERGRFVAYALAVAFHAGIALCLGLYWFSAIMIVAETLVLSDADVRDAMRFLGFARRSRTSSLYERGASPMT